ncbi:MAG: MBOAT family protein [Gammaproteobacteria bacterium]|nr:MBOAT family protein [Gammaproteobacteria bacterium]
MLFNSPLYIFLFLPLTVVFYFILNHFLSHRSAKLFLIFASLFFYAYWDYHYLMLITASIIINYSLAYFIIMHASQQHHSKKLVLIIGIIFNLSLLGFFKYTNFFIENINALMGDHIASLNIILPLAISFFTFQQIAYLVDKYNSDPKHDSFIDYCLFVTFFPQLIAGPIVHYKEMLPQFEAHQQWLKWKHIIIGCFIFFIGLFKKVVIADSFAIWADQGYASYETLNMLQAWATSLSYTFQIYYDFSGYTDMAIGAALLFNIHLPYNFFSPYKATNIKEFWQRWHITLSRWLKSYVYIPLGGNRLGEWKMFRNILITFTLGGLWHGANWTFIAWGMIHALALLTYHLWHQYGFTVYSWLAWCMTFIFINISWIFFRSESIEIAWVMIKKLFEFDSLSLSYQFLDQVSALIHINLYPYFNQTVFAQEAPEWILLLSVCVLFILNYCRNSMQIKERLLENNFLLPWYSLILVVLITAVSISALFVHSSSVFLYFNF